MSASEYYIVLVYSTSLDIPSTLDTANLEHVCTRSFDTKEEATIYANLYNRMKYIHTHIQWVKIDSFFGVMLDE